MNLYALYETDTGRILQMVKCMPRDIAMQCSPGIASLPADDSISDSTHYVVDGEFVARRPYAYTLSTEGQTVTLTGLASGVTVRVKNTMLVTDDEPTELTFELAGTYTLRLSGLVEYLDESLEVAIG